MKNNRHSFKSFGVSDTTQSTKTFFENSIEENVPEIESKMEWLSSAEAAEYLRISPATLRNLTSDGKVPFYKLERRNRYRKDELRDLLLRNRRGGF